jgi:hypothetical protein
VPGRRTWRALAFVAAAGCGLGVVALVGSQEGSSVPRAAAEDQLLPPAPVKPAFDVPTPRPLGEPAWRSLWAPVLRPVVAREKPTLAARPLARLEQRTPEGTANVVLVLGRAEDAAGWLWVRIRLAILPNSSVGWVPRRSLGGYVPIESHLVVDLDRFTATLLIRGKSVFQAPVGVGTPAAPTPTGEFYVRNRVTSYRSAFYGPIAFGTSARSAVLTDWPAGGFIGIHGTDRPELVPGRVSHGCIRMRNDDILRLARLMPVGTPITIR